MTADELALDAQGTAHTAHLVLEEGTQRLHNLQVHLLGQAAHVMVRLDLAARSVDAHALDDIGIDGALGQPTRAFDLLCLGIKHIDKRRTNGFSLGFGVSDALQLFEEKMP